MSASGEEKKNKAIHPARMMKNMTRGKRTRNSRGLFDSFIIEAKGCYRRLTRSGAKQPDETSLQLILLIIHAHDQHPVAGMQIILYRRAAFTDICFLFHEDDLLISVPSLEYQLCFSKLSDCPDDVTCRVISFLEPEFGRIENKNHRDRGESQEKRMLCALGFSYTAMKKKCFSTLGIPPNSRLVNEINHNQKKRLR